MKKKLMSFLALSAAAILASCQGGQPSSSSSASSQGSDESSASESSVVSDASDSADSDSAGSSSSATSEEELSLADFLAALADGNFSYSWDYDEDGADDTFFKFVEGVGYLADYGEDYAKDGLLVVDGKGLLSYHLDDEEGFLPQSFVTAGSLEATDFVYSPLDLYELSEANDWAKSSKADTYILEDYSDLAAPLVQMAGLSASYVDYLSSVKLTLTEDGATVNVGITGSSGELIYQFHVYDVGTTSLDELEDYLDDVASWEKEDWAYDDVYYLSVLTDGETEAEVRGELENILPFAPFKSDYVSVDASYYEDYGLLNIVNVNPTDEWVTNMFDALGQVGWTEAENPFASEDEEEAVLEDAEEGEEEAAVTYYQLPISEDGKTVLLGYGALISEDLDANFYPNGVYMFSFMEYTYPSEGFTEVNAVVENLVIDTTNGEPTVDVMHPAFVEQDGVDVVLYDQADAANEYYDGRINLIFEYFGYDDYVCDGPFMEFYYIVEFTFADTDAELAYAVSYAESLVALGLTIDSTEDAATVASELANGSVALYSNDYLSDVVITLGDEEAPNTLSVAISRWTEDGYQAYSIYMYMMGA